MFQPLFISFNSFFRSITFIIEQKIIHDFGYVCHIEDVIVRKKYYNKGFGTKLLNIAKDVAQQHNCYKIILNCSNNECNSSSVLTPKA